MVYTIQNEHLQLQVDSFGAQLMSLQDSSGREYLWQGDPAYWRRRAPVLFPFIGRLQDEKYRCGGETYSMGIHGFASLNEFAVGEHTGDAITLVLTDNESTRECYPFAFRLEITYRLVGNTARQINRVINCGEKQMHFAFGGHPGFCVPLDEKEAFEDCYVEFSVPCQPLCMGFDPVTHLTNGQDAPYPLEEDRRISLRHDLFDQDAITLKNAAPEVTIKSRRSSRRLRVAYPGMPYVGLWHMPKTDAPFLCVEPWSSLPGRHGVTEQLDQGENYLHLDAGNSWECTFAITIETE